MVELAGELAEEAQEVLNDLHLGIDVGKKIVSATHDFEIKLSAVDMLFMHIDFNYSDNDDLNDFFVDVSDTLVNLGEELEALKKGAIHLILEEEAAEKRGTSWVLKHRKKVGDEIKEEIEVDSKIIKKTHLAFIKLTRLFWDAEHLFSVNIKKATIKAMIEVRVIVIPVLNAPYKFLLVSPYLFNNLVVNIMSESTLYPISIKNAIIPAPEIFIPKKSTNARVIIISANADITTAILGTKLLNKMNTTIAIKIKEIIIASLNCL